MKKKAILAAMCCAALLVGCSKTTTTQTTSEKSTAVETTTESGDNATSTESASIDGAMSGVTLKIGTDTSFVPFCYPDDNNEYVGFDIDMIKAFSEKLGFKYELSPMDFTALLMSVQSNKLDMGAAGITIKPERKEVMDFSQPYYDAGLLVMVNKKNNDITGVDSLSGKKIALKESTSAVDYVNENVKDASITTFPNIENAYLEVERGAADAVVYDSPNILYYLKQNPNSNCKPAGDMFDGAQYGYVFQKGSKYTELFDKALDEFKNDGTYDKIYSKWFGSAK